MLNQEREQQDWARFREQVLADPALQNRLRATATQPEFVALLVRLGTEQGYAFTATWVESALREARQAWLERWL